MLDVMSNRKLLGTVLDIQDNYYQRIRERRRVRQRCLELQDELDEVLYQAQFIDAEDRDLTYLPDTAKHHCVKGDSLIRKDSRPMSDELFHHEPDTIDDEKIDEIKDHLESAVQSINRHNSLVIWGTRGLAVSVVVLLIAILVVQLPYHLL